MPSGEELVSSTAITGIPSLRASRIARSSLLVSITTIRSGTPPMSRMPPSDCCSLSCSRSRPSRSFLVRPSAPDASFSSIDFSRAIEFETVFQLVSVPPSQRWFM